MEQIDPEMEGREPRGSSLFVECRFTAKQYPPTDDDVERDDTDHWYVIVEPQGLGAPLGIVVMSLRLRDDSYEIVSRVARLLDQNITGIDLTVSTGTDAGAM